MSPADLDDLTDSVFDAMVRRMIAEAQAIEKANAELNRVRR